MGKGKGKRPATTSAPDPSIPAFSADATTTFEYESVIAFDNSYNVYASSSATGQQGSSSSQQKQTNNPPKKKKSIKSDKSIQLNGPLEVNGSVNSMGAVGFQGDFFVRDRIEAYGDINVDGNLNSG